MTLPDVTEQRLAIHFVSTLKKTAMQISDILEEVANMFKSIVNFKYLKGGNSELNDCQPGRRGTKCVIPSKERVTSWFPYSYVSRVMQYKMKTFDKLTHDNRQLLLN
jgi:hypothetical protein